MDEWSGDIGAGCKYLSQDAVIKLAPISGITPSESLTSAEKLTEVQKLLEQGTDAAEGIYCTLGAYLGHTLPLYQMLYDILYLLILGRVVSGEDGRIIFSTYKEVLRNEYPTLAEDINIMTRHSRGGFVGSFIFQNRPIPLRMFLVNGNMLRNRNVKLLIGGVMRKGKVCFLIALLVLIVVLFSGCSDHVKIPRYLKQSQLDKLGNYERIEVLQKALHEEEDNGVKQYIVDMMFETRPSSLEIVLKNQDRQTRLMALEYYIENNMYSIELFRFLDEEDDKIVHDVSNLLIGTFTFNTVHVKGMYDIIEQLDNQELLNEILYQRYLIDIDNMSLKNIIYDYKGRNNKSLSEIYNRLCATIALKNKGFIGEYIAYINTLDYEYLSTACTVFASIYRTSPEILPAYIDYVADKGLEGEKTDRIVSRLQFYNVPVYSYYIISILDHNEPDAEQLLEKILQNPTYLRTGDLTLYNGECNDIYESLGFVIKQTDYKDHDKVKEIIMSLIYGKADIKSGQDLNPYREAGKKIWDECEQDKPLEECLLDSLFLAYETDDHELEQSACYAIKHMYFNNYKSNIYKLIYNLYEETNDAGLKEFMDGVTIWTGGSAYYGRMYSDNGFELANNTITEGLNQDSTEVVVLAKKYSSSKEETVIHLDISFWSGLEHAARAYHPNDARYVFVVEEEKIQTNKYYIYGTDTVSGYGYQIVKTVTLFDKLTGEQISQTVLEGKSPPSAINTAEVFIYGEFDNEKLYRYINEQIDALDIG